MSSYVTIDVYITVFTDSCIYSQRYPSSPLCLEEQKVNHHGARCEDTH